MTRKAILVLIMSMALFSSKAEQETDTLDIWEAYELEMVTVTGTRTPRLLSQTPVVTQIITAEDIKKLDATNIQDVLIAEMPGLEFSFSMNQQVSLNMQGLGGLAVLILVDGERLAGETLNNTDFQRLTTDDVERIEIIKGAASALYGSNSVAAVINIITKQSQEAWSANVNTHFAAHGTERHGGNIGFKSGRLSSMTNVQFNKVDSYTIEDTEGDGTTNIYGNRQWNFKQKLVFKMDPRNTVTAKAGYYFHERYYTSYKNNRARDFNTSVRWESALSERAKLDVSYTFDRYDKSDYYTQLYKDFLSYTNRQNSLRALFSYEFDGGLTFIAGGDVLEDYLMSYQFDDNGSYEQYTGDLFTQAEWKVDDNWTLVAGLRGDYIEGCGFNLSERLAAMWSYNKLKVRGSYSRGFRAPSLKERYMNFEMGSIFTIYGNENLVPERSHCFSLSGEYIYKRYSLTATGYFNMMSNEISTLWDSSLVTSLSNGSMVYQNIESRNLLGADVTLMARYPCGITGKLSYAYFHEYAMDGYNTSDSRPHSLTAKVDYKKRVTKNYDFDVILTGRVLSSVNYYTWSSDYSSTDVATSSPAYSIWKLALNQTFCKAYNVLLAVDNLFNYRSKTFAYNSPVTTGTSVSATLSIDVDKIFKK